MKGPNTTFWALNHNSKTVGKVTSAVYSPRLKQNIALAMVEATSAEIGINLTVITTAGERQAVIVEKPFYDPNKQITKA